MRFENKKLYTIQLVYNPYKQKIGRNYNGKG